MKKSLVSISIFTAIILLVVACQHHPDITDIIPPDDNGNNYVTPPDTIEIINTDPCDPDSVYFTNTILPLLSSNCAMADCHDAITHEEGVRMYDYAHIMQQVEAGSLSNSDLWDAINETGDDMMPPADNGGPLSNDQMLAIRTWILQGANNNSCTEDCNPADFSYAANIKPIIDLTCGGCHSGNNPSGTVLLETYSQINAAALDGSLMSSLHGTDGYSIMPDNSTDYLNAILANFQNWVNAGAPNNLMNLMSRKTIILFFSMVTFLLVSSLYSCYYDREDYLYSTTTTCTDTVYSYIGRIKTIVDQNCATSGCHAGASPEGGIGLENYADVKNNVENGQFLCSITWEQWLFTDAKK